MRDLAIVCEPNESDQTCRATLLREMGHEVRVLERALDCEWVARMQNPQIVLISVDALWGGGDGIRECLNERSSVQPVPLLLVMGTASVEVLSSTSGLPATQCLRKPLSSAKLRTCLKTVLCHRDHSAAQPQPTSGTLARSASEEAQLRSLACASGECEEAAGAAILGNLCGRTKFGPLVIQRAQRVSAWMAQTEPTPMNGTDSTCSSVLSVLSVTSVSSVADPFRPLEGTHEPVLKLLLSDIDAQGVGFPP